MRDITICVSAGLLRPKKRDTPFARRHRYLNFGLLTLATVLANRGYNVRMVHGDFRDPAELARELVPWLGATFSLLLLSIPSYLALPWAQAFVSALRILCPHVRIVVGGRWVVKRDGRWIRRQIPEADLVVYGAAEKRVPLLLQSHDWSRVPGTDLFEEGYVEDGDEPYVHLLYNLMDEFTSFPPSVEVSRGCGMACGFCDERDAGMATLRDPLAVLTSVKGTLAQYRLADLRFYFEASYFHPSRSWAERLLGAMKAESVRVKWRCETRIDTLDIDLLPPLAEAGLMIIDLGLESASPKQLLAMGKTTDPQRYLRNASSVLRRCRELGIWAKVNVMLFAGESPETVAQTLEWLEGHRACIKGISAGPVIVYGHTREAQEYLKGLSQLGAMPVLADGLDSVGFTHLHLSSTIDYSRAMSVSDEISRAFMTDRDYFDLKHESYFDRTYSFSEFLRDIRTVSDTQLPFTITTSIPDEQ